MSYIIVSLGGFFGAILRYGLINIFNTSAFSYGVLIANSLGSFLVGVSFVLISEKFNLSEAYRVALIVGFCGSLTTLSTISFESVNLFTNGEYGLALVNLVSNIVLSLFFIIFGMYITRLF